MKSLEKEKIRKRLKEIEILENLALLKDPHKIYIPIGKSEEFLDTFGSTDVFTVLYGAANGVGKTTLLANIVRAVVMPTDNEYFQQKLFRENPYPVKAIRVVSNHNTLNETLIPTLKEWLPSDSYTTNKKGKSYEYEWIFKSGWRLYVLTYDQPPQTFESANVSITLFDEPPPQEIYKASVSRMRRGGQIGILATMLDGSEWMYDNIILDDDINTAFVTAEVEDACIEHGVRGFLKHEDIVRMISQYDEDDMQARVFGRPQHLTGLVFKEFDKRIHVISPFEINYNDFVVWHSLDPHTRNPDAAVWVAIDRQNRYFVFDEIYDNHTTDELAIKVERNSRDLRIIKNLIDPSAMIQDQHTGKSLAGQLQEKGLAYVAGSKRRGDATRKLKDLIHVHKIGDEIIYSPGLYIFETCPRAIYEFTHWKYDEYSRKTAMRKSPRESGEDKDDHMIEAIGRIVLENPRFIELPIQQKQFPREYTESRGQRSNTGRLSSYDPY